MMKVFILTKVLIIGFILIGGCNTHKAAVSGFDDHIQLDSLLLSGNKMADISLKIPPSISEQAVLSLEFTIRPETYDPTEKYVISGYIMDSFENSESKPTRKYLGSFSFFSPPIIGSPAKFVLVIPDIVKSMLSSASKQKTHIQLQIEPVNRNDIIKGSHLTILKTELFIQH